MAKNTAPAAPPAPEPTTTTATATLELPPDPLAGYAAPPPVTTAPVMAGAPLGVVEANPDLLARLTADAQTADDRTPVMPKPQQVIEVKQAVDPNGYVVQAPRGCFSLVRLFVVNVLTQRERELCVPLHLAPRDWPLHRVMKGEQEITVERVKKLQEEMYGGEAGEQDRNFVLANQENPYTRRNYGFVRHTDPLAQGELKAMALGTGVQRAGV